MNEKHSDPMCDADNCSGGTTLKDEQPEFCKLVVCSESECCDEVSGKSLDDLIPTTATHMLGTMHVVSKPDIFFLSRHFHMQWHVQDDGVLRHNFRLKSNFVLKTLCCGRKQNSDFHLLSLKRASSFRHIALRSIFTKAYSKVFN